MAISLAQLRFAETSPQARRLLWHVLSIGFVSRDEPEHHEGLDKAGLFLFQVAAGAGRLELRGQRYPLERGDRCWLVDLRHARTYRPAGGKALRTASVRFSGPGLEAWLELLGDDPVFELPPGRLRGYLRRLHQMVRRRAPGYEWQIHRELTALWGELLAARRIFTVPQTEVPACVARVVEVVQANPARSWKARELAQFAGVSYSRLRFHFHRARGETLQAFLHHTRLDLARLLLSDRRLSIKEVAERMNFSSEFYFSHFFRRATGMSPTQFRERCRA